MPAGGWNCSGEGDGPGRLTLRSVRAEFTKGDGHLDAPAGWFGINVDPHFRVPAGVFPAGFPDLTAFVDFDFVGS